MCNSTHKWKQSLKKSLSIRHTPVFSSEVQTQGFLFPFHQKSVFKTAVTTLFPNAVPQLLILKKMTKTSLFCPLALFHKQAVWWGYFLWVGCKLKVNTICKYFQRILVQETLALVQEYWIQVFLHQCKSLNTESFTYYTDTYKLRDLEVMLCLKSHKVLIH